MPRKRREERKWTEPSTLVPIIAAIITAIVGPIVLYLLIQDRTNDEEDNIDTPNPEPPPTNTPTSSPTRIPIPTPPVESNALSVRTDKESYGFGDEVQVNGTVDQPTKGKTVRLDVYDPRGTVFASYEPFNLTTVLSGGKPHSHIQVTPDDRGLFTYEFPLSVSSPESGIKGNYTVEATYNGANKKTLFTVR